MARVGDREQPLSANEREILARVRNFAPAQQELIIDLLDFLERRREFQAAAEPTGETFGEVAAEFIGCVDGGPGDLATSPNHMEGYGRTRSVVSLSMPVRWWRC